MRISVITCSIRPDGLSIIQKGLAAQTFTDFEWIVELSIPERGHDLNRAYNRALRRAKGELIVSLQDWIRVTPLYLQRFWDAYRSNPRDFLTAPVGKVPNADFSGQPKWDWRAYSDAKPKWMNWEIDSGAAARSALFEIGGFDEELDGHWSCDNLSVGWRAHLAGYGFANVFDNPSVAFDHDAHAPHPFRDAFDPQFNAYRMRKVEMGDLKIDYLH